MEEAAASDRERAAAEEAIMTQRAEQTALIQRLLEKQRRSLDEESEGRCRVGLQAGWGKG